MSEPQPQPSLMSRIGRWLYDRVSAAADKAAEHVLWLVVLAVVSGGGTVLGAIKGVISERWTIVAGASAVFVLSLIGITLATIKLIRIERRALRDQVAALEQDKAVLRETLSRERRGSEAARTLVYQMLEAISLEIERFDEWDVQDLVERGILGPVRGLLTRTEEEDIRLCVLHPHLEDERRWTIRWAAGMWPQDVRGYNAEIDRTLAGVAFRSNKFLTSKNAPTDTRVARREAKEVDSDEPAYLSEIDVPLRISGVPIAVLSVQSTLENAFRETDRSFVKEVSAVLNLLLALEFEAYLMGEGLQGEVEGG